MRPRRFHDRDGAGLSEFFGSTTTSLRSSAPKSSRRKRVSGAASHSRRPRDSSHPGRPFTKPHRLGRKAALIDESMKRSDAQGQDRLGRRPNSRARPSDRRALALAWQATVRTANAAPATINPHSAVASARTIQHQLAAATAVAEQLSALDMKSHNRDKPTRATMPATTTSMRVGRQDHCDRR